jgi:hypothetical protein
MMQYYAAAFDWRNWTRTLHSASDFDRKIDQMIEKIAVVRRSVSRSLIYKILKGLEEVEDSGGTWRTRRRRRRRRRRMRREPHHIEMEWGKSLTEDIGVAKRNSASIWHSQREGGSA